MDDHKDCPSGDEFVITSSCDGHAHLIRHRPDHSVESGTIMPVEDGKPIPPGAEFIHAESIGDGRYAIRSSFKTGPAQVATKPYRDGWERTFNNASN